MKPGKQLTLLFFITCMAAFSQDRNPVSKELSIRTGHGLKPGAPSRESSSWSLPPGISLTGKITEDEAVAIALWNNSAFEATLSSLGLARADLVEARLLRNPSLQMLLPIGPKPFEFALQAPVEALWQRPRRVAAANLNLQQVSEGLVQNGLDLARDARIAHTELEFAGRRASIARDSAALRAQIAELTERRFKAGDISEMDAVVSRSEARSFEEVAVKYAADVELAGERLRMLMGLRRDKTRFAAVPTPAEPAAVPEWEALVETAFSSRPDLRAAELSIQAATQRARWERSRVLALVGAIFSIKGVGSYGIRTGPGLYGDLPVFQRNQGGISRADAEVERATLMYLALRDRIELEAREARLQLLAAQESLLKIRQDILPSAQESIRLAEKAYANGDASFLYVLEATRQIYDVHLRDAEAQAAIRRARAQLDRSVGRKL